MIDFFTLACTSCDTKFQISDSIKRFACARCGIEHDVKRTGGIVSISPFVEGIKNGNTGVEKIDAGIEITRIKTEVLGSQKNIKDKPKLFAFSDFVFAVGLIGIPIFIFKVFMDGIEFRYLLLFLMIFSPIFAQGWILRKQENKVKAEPETQ